MTAATNRNGAENMIVKNSNDKYKRRVAIRSK